MKIELGIWTEADLLNAVRVLQEEFGFAWLDANEGRSYLAVRPSQVVQVDWPNPIRQALDTLSPSQTAEENYPRWIGYIAYDAAFCADMESTRPSYTANRRRGRALCFHRYDSVVDIDSSGLAAIRGEPAACRVLQDLLLKVSQPQGACTVTEIVVDGEETHEQRIAKAREAIADGDVYQVNLARRWEGKLSGDAFALWMAMRKASPVPRGLYFTSGDEIILGRSMETYLDFDAHTRVVTSRPIKGTISRKGEDAEEQTALHTSEKERAEHCMIVDLIRNDLSRIAERASVQVVEALAIEPYAGLHHMVSTVQARLRSESTLTDLICETFPPGSVTGTPKLAAIEYIDTLESGPRGVYCGAYGYVSSHGDMKLAVAIRTAVVTGKSVCYHAGGGIVWLSDPAAETAETTLKARVFLDACLERQPADALGDWC